MKLNGWKRIGIIASITWILGAGIYTLNTESNRDIKFAGTIMSSCIESHNGADPGNQCLRDGANYIVSMVESNRLNAAFIAIVPVPLGWGFIYLVLFLVRWIRRGF